MLHRTHDMLSAVVSNIMVDRPLKLFCRSRVARRLALKGLHSSGTEGLYLSVVWSLSPSRPQALHDVVPGSDHLFRYPTHTIGTVADVVDLRSRPGADITSSTANASSIGATITVLESRRRRKIKCCKCARFSKMVTITCQRPHEYPII